MSSFWAAVANEQYPEELFCAAANHLIYAQALYYETPTDRAHYRVIETHERLFRDFLRNLGLNLHVDRGLRYVVAVSPPDAPYRHRTLRKDESLLLAVLRKIYDQRMGSAESDDGRVDVDLGELVDIYRTETGLELPESQKELRGLVDRVCVFGVARVRSLGTEEEQPFSVVILPAIEQILNLEHCSKLAAAYAAATAETTAVQPDDSDEETGDRSGDSAASETNDAGEGEVSDETH